MYGTMKDYADNVTTLTVGGTATATLGRKVHRYVIRTNGTDDATLAFTLNTSGGTAVWTRVVDGPDMSAEGWCPAVPAPNRLFATLTGTGASCDIHWD